MESQRYGVQWGDDRFLEYFEYFVDVLDPSLKYLENRIYTALRNRYPAGPGEPVSAFIEMIWKREHCSYVIGVLMVRSWLGIQ
jgi:hypothetical protein